MKKYILLFLLMKSLSTYGQIDFVVGNSINLLSKGLSNTIFNGSKNKYKKNFEFFHKLVEEDKLTYDEIVSQLGEPTFKKYIYFEDDINLKDSFLVIYYNFKNYSDVQSLCNFCKFNTFIVEKNVVKYFADIYDFNIDHNYIIRDKTFMNSSLPPFSLRRKSIEKINMCTYELTYKDNYFLNVKRNLFTFQKSDVYIKNISESNCGNQINSIMFSYKKMDQNLKETINQQTRVYVRFENLDFGTSIFVKSFDFPNLGKPKFVKFDLY